MGRWLVMNTTPNNETGDDSGWTYALVNIGHPPTATALRDACLAFAAADGLKAIAPLRVVEVKFHFDDCLFVSHVTLPKQWDGEFDTNRYVIVNGDPPKHDKAPYEPYAVYLSVGDESLFWTAVDKHTDNVVETAGVPGRLFL